MRSAPAPVADAEGRNFWRPLEIGNSGPEPQFLAAAEQPQ
jgi:hypothetical protein